MTDNINLVYLRQKAEESKQWIAAGCQIGNEFDTYPADLFRAAVTEDVVIALLNMLEANQAEFIARDRHDDSFVARINELLAERNAAQAQLPKGMEHCTILFKECEKGHGRLTATNWVQHGCSTCELEAAQAEVANLRRKQRVTEGLAGVYEAERDAALARLAELEKQEPVAEVEKHQRQQCGSALVRPFICPIGHRDKALRSSRCISCAANQRNCCPC